MEVVVPNTPWPPPIYRDAVRPHQCPGHFQRFGNNCRKDLLDLFCTAYLDDILIYSDTVEAHQKHVKKVLHTLRANNFLLEQEKWEFHKQTTTYLGLIVSLDTINMDPAKV